MVLKGGLKIMKFNLKKIATIVGSALMVGATAGMAAAASLPSNFNNPAVVYGTGAAVSDSAAAQSLVPAFNLKAVSSGSSVSVSGGDSVKIESGNKYLTLGTNTVKDVLESLSDDNLKSFLKSGDFKDNESDKQYYTQSMKLIDGTLKYDEDSNDNLGLGLFYEDGDNVLNYTIDYGSIGLNNIVGIDLPFMGKNYYVLRNTNSEIVMLDSSSSTRMNEDESKTLTVGDKSYEVTATDVYESGSSSYAKFTVNGEPTDKLTERKEYKLDDGAYIVVKEIIARDSGNSGKSNSVEFTIASGKLSLPKTLGEISLSDKTVDGVSSTIAGGKITITWEADDDITLIKSGDSAVMPGFETISVVYGGMDFPSASEETRIDANNVLSINTEVKDGTISIPLVNAKNISGEGNVSYLGTSDKKQLVIGTQVTANKEYSVNLTDNDYFIATYLDDSDSVSYVYKLNGVSKNDNNDYKVTLTSLASGNDEIVFNREGDTRKKGSIEFNLTNYDAVNKIATINFKGDKANVRNTTLVTKSGLKIDLSAVANITTANYTTGVSVTFTEQDKDGKYSAESKSFTVSLKDNGEDGSAKKVQVGSTNVTVEESSDDVYEGYVMSDLATKVERNAKDSKSVKFSISYFGKQVKADVKIVAGGEVSTTTQAGGPVLSDSEATSLTGRSIIVVGGSCVNSLAAELIGGAYCGAEFTEKTGIKLGEAMIKSYDYKDGIAVVVAGYEAADTERAVTKIKNEGLSSVSDLNSKLTVTNTIEAI